MICHYNAKDNFFAFKQVNYAIVNQDARGNLGTLRHYHPVMMAWKGGICYLFISEYRVNFQEEPHSSW